MRKFHGMIANSRPDGNGDVIAVEALEQMVDQISKTFVPLNEEHDPRKPILGRLLSARLVKEKDGTYAIWGTGEYINPDDDIPLDQSKREIPLRIHEVNNYDFLFDRMFLEESDRKILNEIGELLSCQPREEVKKSADPISVLTISAGIAGAFATGFLAKMGADSWGQVKNKVHQLIKKKNAEGITVLVVFEFTSHAPNSKRKINYKTILENPSEQELNNFVRSGLKQLEARIKKHSMKSRSIRLAVYKFENGKISSSYAVRKDSVPMKL